MKLNLALHRYAVVQHGEPTSFWSNLPLAAKMVFDRNAHSVVNLETNQSWSREECLAVAQNKAIGRAA